MRAQWVMGGGWEATDQELQKELESGVAAARLSGDDKASSFGGGTRKKL